MRTSDVPAQTRTKHIPNTIQERYLYSVSSSVMQHSQVECVYSEEGASKFLRNVGTIRLHVVTSPEDSNLQPLRGLLGCGAVKFGTWLAMRRRNILPTFSGSTIKTGAACSFKTSVSIYQTARRINQKTTI
jgi:hypothetical protein